MHAYTMSPHNAELWCSELSRLKDAFVLRRTAELNAQFLPPASTYIVFCRPTPLQVWFRGGGNG